MTKNQRLNATITIGSVLEASVKKNVGFLKSGLSQVSDSIREVERRQKELGRQRDVLRKQGQSVEALDREYEDLERTLNNLRRTQERFNRAAVASVQVGAAFKRMASDIGQNARRIAVGATLVGGSVFGLASATANAAREVVNLSNVANTSPREFQRMAAAAESVGIEQEKLGDILKDVNDRIGDFLETGGGPMADFFENIGPKVGVTIKDFQKLSGKDALLLYVDSLEKAGLSQQEMTFYLEAMASDTTNLIPLLQNGGKELERLGDRAEETGRILDEKTLASATEFRAELGALKGVFIGLRNTIGAAFLPVLTKSMRQIGDALVANRGDVDRWASEFADGFERVLPIVGEVVQGIGRVSAVVWGAIDSTASLVGGWENLGIVVGAVLASRTVMRVGKFAFAVFNLGRAMVSLAAATPLVAGGIRAIGSALLMNPIGIAIAAIAGGAYLIYRNWGAVSSWFSGMWSDTKSYFSGFADFVGGVFTADLSRSARGVEAMWGSTGSMLGRVFSGIGTNLGWAYQNLIKPVTDALGITDPIEQAWSGLRSGLSEKIGAIGSSFDRAWSSYISPVIAGLSETGGIGAAWASVQSALAPVLTWIGDRFSAVLRYITPVIDALKWGLENGRAAVGAVTGSFGRGGEKPGVAAKESAANSGRSGLSADRQAAVLAKQREFLQSRRAANGNRPPVKARALGGAYTPGWLLTGEKGPELKFESRAGYVANNRAMRELASFAGRIGSTMGRKSSLGSARSSAPDLASQFEGLLKTGRAQSAAPMSAPITQNMTVHINASGLSADELWRVLERKQRQAANGGLFDRVPASGPFGR